MLVGLSQTEERVATGNGLIQNSKKFGPDITRDTRVPGRIKQKRFFPPTPALVLRLILPELNGYYSFQILCRECILKLSYTMIMNNCFIFCVHK